MRKFGKDSMIDEFERNGFVRGHGGTVLNILRKEYSDRYRRFDSGNNNAVGRSGGRYGSYDIFGDRMCYYYDIERKEEFVRFLVERFYGQNPLARGDGEGEGSEMRKIFTRMLHDHGMCWDRCRHG